jgi:hypothetical protein
VSQMNELETSDECHPQRASSVNLLRATASSYCIGFHACLFESESLGGQAPQPQRFDLKLGYSCWQSGRESPPSPTNNSGILLGRALAQHTSIEFPVPAGEKVTLVFATRAAYNSDPCQLITSLPDSKSNGTASPKRLTS